MTNLNRISIVFTIEEIEDLIINLDQCWCEGYIHHDSPARSAWERLEKVLEKWKETNEEDI